ncbi:hypothetical protein BH23BAC3_BH23BAC3_27270 [soil metagenome]
MNKIKTIIQNSPFVIALIYISVGFLWIQFSDQIVLSLFDEAEAITHTQSLKGWFFVGASGFLIFLLVRKNNSLLDDVIVDLTKSRDKFYATFEQAPVGIVHHRPNEKWIEINQTLCDILGYRKSELLRLNFEDFIHPEDLQTSRHLDQELLDGKRKKYQIKKRYKTIEGNYIYGMLTKSAVINKNNYSRSYLVGIVQDITKKIEADEKIRNTLHQKELLLSEIHHRVKNNLALISSLIELEGLYTEGQNARSVLDKCRLRVKCLAMIYETFSHNEQTTSVNFSKFLIHQIELLNHRPKNGCKIFLENEEPSIYININQAIPLSLICNEILYLINANKLSKTLSPDVTIDLYENSGDIILKLSDQDNSNTWKENFTISVDPDTEIINTLITQLNGSFKMNSEERGNTFELRFERKDLKGSGSSVDIRNL